MNLRLGNQTSFAAGNFLEPFEFALANGFSAFEFFPDRGFSGTGGWDERDVGAPVRQEIRQRAADRDMLLTVHAPLAFDPLANSQDDRLYSTVAFASEIGARLMVLHLDVSRGPERFLEAIGPARMVAAETGLQLALENTVHTGPDNFNRFFTLLQSSGVEPVSHIGVCFDMGHANLCAVTRND
jgi:sugar phosphate isomerase/epimerase